MEKHSIFLYSVNNDLSANYLSLNSNNKMLPYEWLRISTTKQRATNLLNSADAKSNEITTNIIPDYYMDWDKKLKEYRKHNNLTQIELAIKMGVNQYTLRSWEQKQAKPPYEKWKLLNDLLVSGLN